MFASPVQQEDHFRRLFATNRASAELNSPTLHLSDVYADDGRSWTYAPSNVPADCLYLTHRQRRIAIGGAALVDRAAFTRRWDAFSHGLFGALDWRNVVVAGGAVLACMLRGNGDSDEDSAVDDVDGDAYGSSDIDLFVYGVDVAAANAKLRAIYECVRARVPQAQVVRTGNAVTIIPGYPHRYIQVSRDFILFFKKMYAFFLKKN